jgi:uncharacterized protein (TIRG00374 family)
MGGPAVASRPARRRTLLQPRVLIGVAVSVGFLAWLLSGTDLAKVSGALVGADYRLVALSLVLVFVALWLRAIRWRYLLSPFRDIPTPRLFRMTVIGYMANSLLPALAGELLRCYLIGRNEGVEKATVLGGIAVERVVDGLTLLGLLALAMLVVPFDAEWLGGLVTAALVMFFGAALVFGVVIARPKSARRLIGRALRPLPRRIRPRMERVMAGFLDGLSVLASPRIALGVIVTSVLGWAVDFVVMFPLLWAFGTTASPDVVAVSTAVGNLGTAAVPASAGGIGPFEFFTAQALVLGGVDPTIAAAFALLRHFSFIGAVVGVGLVFLWLENLRPAFLAEPEKAG